MRRGTKDLAGRPSTSGDGLSLGEGSRILAGTMSDRRPFDERLFSGSARGLRFSAIRRMSALTEGPGVISFAPGHPSPETFPVDELREIVGEIVGRDSAGAFQYIPTRGLKE